MVNEQLTHSNHTHSLKGKLLVATPDIDRGIFHQSIVLICSHDENGALGFVINRPLSSLTMQEMMEQFELEGPDFGHKPLFLGGPLSKERGFILYGSHADQDGIEITSDISLTVDLKMLEKIHDHQGPDHYLMMLGYAGWGADQLEEEIANNSWFAIDPAYDLLFDCPPSRQWQEALHHMGIVSNIFISPPGVA